MTELELSVGLPSELIAVLVNGLTVPATKQGQIRERGGPAVGPVANVMALPEADFAARETTAAVSVMHRAPERRRNRAGPGRHLDDSTVDTVLHHHTARVARQALRRFGGNAHAVLEDGLAGLIGVREYGGVDGGVDVDDHLIALARGTGIDPVMERGLGEQPERVGLLRLHRGRFPRIDHEAGLGARRASLLIQRLGRHSTPR